MSRVKGHPTRGRVVVGYDGRWQSPSVLEIGAKAAERFDCPLSIVTLYRSPDDLASLQARPLDGWHPQPTIRRHLQQAAQLLREQYPDLRISTHAVCFDDVRAGAEPFRSAALLVLGERHARALEVPAVRTAGAVLREATACSVVVVTERADGSAGESAGTSAGEPADDPAGEPAAVR